MSCPSTRSSQNALPRPEAVLSPSLASVLTLTSSRAQYSKAFSKFSCLHKNRTVLAFHEGGTSTSTCAKHPWFPSGGSAVLDELVALESAAISSRVQLFRWSLFAPLATGEEDTVGPLCRRAIGDSNVFWALIVCVQRHAPSQQRALWYLCKFLIPV